MMIDPARLFRILGDETRLRMLHLLGQEELTAREIQQVMNVGQSRVSAQLAQLREVLPLRERRDGRRVYLELDRDDAGASAMMDYVEPLIRDREACRADRRNLAELRRRQAASEQGVDDRLERHRQPGRTWEGLSRGLLEVADLGRVLDVGVGDGELTLLVAEAARSLTAVEPDAPTRERFLRQAAARGREDIDLHEGEIESLPLPDEGFDLVLASQVLHCAEDPARGVAECARVLAPGGRLLVLDLRRHAEAWVRERHEHRHLGFDPAALRTIFGEVGLAEVSVRPVARDPRPPHFVTLLASGRKVSS